MIEQVYPTAGSVSRIGGFDETLPALWEWDVKRLDASFVLACRNNGVSEDGARDAEREYVRSESSAGTRTMSQPMNPERFDWPCGTAYNSGIFNQS